MFQKGISGNPSGRPKLQVVDDSTPIKFNNSVLTIRGKIERFLKKNMTSRQLQLMYGGLKESQRLEMLLLLLPYAVAKVQPDSLSAEEIETLYSKLEQTIKHADKKAG